MIEIYWNNPTVKNVTDFFWSMSEDQAKEFFKEFMNSKDEHIKELREEFAATGGGLIHELNLTPQSLKPIWRWASKYLTLKEFTPAELAEINKLPSAIAEIRMSQRTFTDDTFRLLFDVSLYFGEVCIHNLDGVYWTISRTGVPRFIYENQPILAGYDPMLNPQQAVTVCGFKTISDPADPDRLFKTYQKCTENWVGNNCA